MAVNTISNIGQFAKIVYPDYFDEDGGRNPHHSDSKNYWLQEVVVSKENIMQSEW